MKVFDRALAVIVMAAYFKMKHVESAPSLEMISDYFKNENSSVTESVLSTTSLKSPTNKTLDVIEYEDFDDIEEDRSLKEVSKGESMIKLFTGLISLMGLLQAFKNVNPQVLPSVKLKSQKLNVQNENEPRKIKINKRVEKAQERFLPHQQTNNNENMKDQEYQPVENYPPYNPLTANAAETYMKNGKKTSYDVYNSQSSISPYNHKNEEVEIIPSISYEIPYETPKPAKQIQETSNIDDMSWNNLNIRPVYQPWMTKTETNPPPSYIDSYQTWNDKPQDKVKPQKDIFTDSQPWQGKMPQDDSPSYPQYSFKNPPPPPPPDHHFEYEEIDHAEDHPIEEDRVNKKPYSYYFLGRKLWYIPLLFSVYFMVYVGALVLKSVARHKIQFPEKLWDLHDHHTDHLYGHGKNRRHRKIDDVTETVENAIDKMNNKFM